MNRWTSILGALMLVLMLWTSATAHAAQPFDCSPATAEVTGDLEGGQDQLPSGPDQGVADDHAGCGAHHAAAPGNVAAIDMALLQNLVPVSWREFGRPGDSPGSELRPPIV